MSKREDLHAGKWEDLHAGISAIVPGVERGMFVVDALELILTELKRLKQIEAEYERINRVAQSLSLRSAERAIEGCKQ